MEGAQPTELVRLSKVARECNLGLHTLVEFLWQRGHRVEGNPNAKIPFQLYREILDAFQQDRKIRELANAAVAARQAREAVLLSTPRSSKKVGYWIVQPYQPSADEREYVNDLALDVKDNDLTKAGRVILIDIFYTFRDPEYQSWQDLAGIALLKFLRLVGVRNHIVLLSPWTLAELLQMDPSNHLLASKGISVAPYTYDQDELEKAGVRLEELKQLPVSYDLRPYFLSGMRLPKDERHNWANWWGLYVLIRLHNSYARWVDIAYPIPLIREFTTLRNRIAIFVHEPSQIEAAGQYPMLNAPCNILYIDDQADEGWEEVLSEILCTTQGDRASLFTVVPWPGALKDEKGCEQFYKDHLHEPIYGSQEVKACDMVILDVRLDRRMDDIESGDPEKLSGMRLLKHLRHKHPGLPILAFTASRRPEVHRALLDNGADRIHLKAALDQGHDPAAASQSSLKHLVESVNLLAGERYDMLWKFGEFYRRLLEGEDFWWKAHQFTTGDSYCTAESFMREVDCHDFVDAVGGALSEYRFILQDYGQIRETNIRFAFSAANLINRLGGLVEFIHTGGKRKKGLSEIIYRTDQRASSRGDLLGWLLMQCRHNASHYGASRKTLPKHLDGFMKGLLSYLDAKSFPEITEQYSIHSVYRGASRLNWWHWAGNTKAHRMTDAEWELIRGKDLIDHMLGHLTGSHT